MKKVFALLITLFLIFLTPSLLFAQDGILSEPDSFTETETSAETDPDEEAEEEEEDDDPRLKLIINYQKEEEEAPFLIVTYRHDPGFLYNIAVPYLEGYDTDSPRLLGELNEDTEMTVSYHLSSYSLTVHYRRLDGQPVTGDHQQPETFGSEYSITSPYVAGYKPITTVIEGVMPGRDVELTIFYVDKNTIIE